MYAVGVYVRVYVCVCMQVSIHVELMNMYMCKLFARTHVYVHACMHTCMINTHTHMALLLLTYCYLILGDSIFVDGVAWDDLESKKISVR